MEQEIFFGAAYQGNDYQDELPTARSKTFGSGSSDYTEKAIDLNEQLIRNRAATYFLRMKGDAMKDAGIFDNDILVVDRSIKNPGGRVIVAILNGELMVRRFHKNFSSAFLIPENDRYKTINLAEFGEFNIWGVVIHSIHSL